MIPEPDYNEDDRPNYRRICKNFNNNNINDNMKFNGGGVVMDKEGLVVPRKPANPCIASMERRDLHRELAFHQKTWVGPYFLRLQANLQNWINVVMTMVVLIWTKHVEDFACIVHCLVSKTNAISNMTCTVCSPFNILWLRLLLYLWLSMTRGKAVLNQKSELQKALQKQKEVQGRKEVEKERQSTRSALEITLEKRAQRLEEVYP